MGSIKIGIIGGTGLNNPDILKNQEEIEVTTPFGKPSDGTLLQGEIEGIPCIIVSRHGRAHNIPPSKVNFRANIWALKQLGCTHIIATTATGSLKEEIKPGDFVVLDDFVDRTYKRRQTFYDGEEDSFPGIFHLPMHPPFSKSLRETIIETAKDLGLNWHETGTVVTIEGPRFSSKAESKMYQAIGCDVINMTTVPEVMLAKEAGLLYSAVAVVTDYDCWKEDYQSVSHEFVLLTLKQNVEKIKQLIVSTIVNISKKNWDKDIIQMQDLVKNSLM